MHQVDGCEKNPRSTNIRILLPHEVLDAMARSSTYAFESVFLGHLSDEARTAFWEHVSTLEPWKGHPIIKQGNWKRLLGIHIHGDGCEFYREDEYFVWSWSSIFSTSGSIQDVLISRFPIAVIPERWMKQKHVAHLDSKVCNLFFLGSSFENLNLWFLHKFRKHKCPNLILPSPQGS